MFSETVREDRRAKTLKLLSQISTHETLTCRPYCQTAETRLDPADYTRFLLQLLLTLHWPMFEARIHHEVFKGIGSSRSSWRFLRKTITLFRTRSSSDQTGGYWTDAGLGGAENTSENKELCSEPRWLSDDFNLEVFLFSGCPSSVSGQTPRGFTSPNYPNDYPNGDNCSWGITVPRGFVVKVEFFHFSTEANHDELRIYDGPSASSSLLATLSGMLWTPLELMSTGTSLWFNFRTNSNISSQGFQATHTAVRPIAVSGKS